MPITLNFAPILGTETILGMMVRGKQQLVYKQAVSTITT
ncbi:transposase [Bacillus sp. IT-79MI2]|nr:hypothetical protein BTH41_03896 [Bacillus mycoides]